MPSFSKQPDPRDSATQTHDEPSSKQSQLRLATLIEDLKDGDSQVRHKAATALRALGPDARDAVPALAAALKDPDRDARHEASCALGSIGPAAVPALIIAIKDVDGNVRREAAWALKLIGPDAREATSVVAIACKDSDPSVRFWARRALRRIGPDAAPALVAALKDPAEEVCDSAVDALSEIFPKA